MDEKREKTERHHVTYASFNRYAAFVLALFLAIFFAKLRLGVLSGGEIFNQNTQEESRDEFTSPAQLKALEFAKTYTGHEEYFISEIMTAISPLREALRKHPLYSKMTTDANVVEFMNTHVYCVWDFMNLVKRLQSHFTSITLPWKPSINNEARFFCRLANEIILEEESDELDGTFISHFSYYVESIHQSQGYLSDHLTQFIADVSNVENSYETIVTKDYIKKPVRDFLISTRHSSTHDNILVTLASFTFGREVLLPEIFTEILIKSGMADKANMSMFVKYLDRHITLDGDYHGYLAKKMVIGMIKDESDLKLEIGEAVRSLNARLALWDHLNEVLA